MMWSGWKNSSVSKPRQSKGKKMLPEKLSKGGAIARTRGPQGASRTSRRQTPTSSPWPTVFRRGARQRKVTDTCIGQLIDIRLLHN